jgi:hypothetical protein
MTEVVNILPTFKPGTSETQNENKKRLKKKEFEYGNNVDYNELLSSFFDDISYCIVDVAKTENQPN